MSYFTEILAESSQGWRARDLDVRDSETLEELLEVMRSASEQDGDVVAVIEHEDDWFALVRLRPDDESRVFLSNIDAVRESPFAEVFEEYLDGPVADLEEEFEPAEEEAEEKDEEEEKPAMLASDQKLAWSGDADLFADYGITAEGLLDQVEEHSDDPARVVAHVGEAVGFAEQLEAVR